MEQEFEFDEDGNFQPTPETVLQFVAYCMIVWQEQEGRPIAVDNTLLENKMKSSFNQDTMPYITVEHQDNITKLIAELR